MNFNDLFYKDPYLTKCTAAVLSCRPVKKGYAIVLGDTVFYPEGGGQPADRGVFYIVGEEIAVNDVQRNSSGEIEHFVDVPLDSGSEVSMEIDWHHRFSLMQNHTGEHIVSGLIHGAYGYENVGFHMSDVITIDISGELSWKQAMEIERKANSVIWKNLPVNITFPESGKLEELDFRSKKELTGKVRLIDIDGTDLCACCGLHVKHTGEIGMIKLLSLINYKGGVRIEMVCGEKALLDYEAKLDSNTEIKNLLSVKPHEVTDAVKHILNESTEKSARISGLCSRYFDMRTAELISDVSDDGIIITLEEDLDGIEIRKLCEKLKNSDKADVYIVLRPLPSEEESFQYVIASRQLDLKEKAPSLNKALRGKGGGSKEMIQGTFFTSYDEICKVIRNVFTAQ